MTDNDQALQTGDAQFEAFVEEVKQALGHLYDFAYLQQHSLARVYDRAGELSAKTAGRQLRYELLKAIESLEEQPGAHFRAPVARLHNILHLYYVENLSMQSTATELGLSERQAYRDLRRGQERVAAVLWDNRLASLTQQPDVSIESEVARLKLNVATLDIREVFHKAQQAVARLAQEAQIAIQLDQTEAADQPLTLATDAVLARQIVVSLLSTAIQQAQAGVLQVALAASPSAVDLLLTYQPQPESDPAAAFSAVTRLAQRLRWQVAFDVGAGAGQRVTLHMTSETPTILVVDDNEGWIELLGRFLKGFNYLVVSADPGQDCVAQAAELDPALIILDVMMPERDGWEVLQRLRMQPATVETPIIMCTVLEDAQLAYSLGATGFISKPASREKILDALRELSII